MQRTKKQRELRGAVWPFVVGGFIVVGVVAALPLFANNYFLRVVGYALLMAYVCSAWNIMGGYAGLLSFGHAAFYGIGSYTTFVLLSYWGVSGWIGMLAGAVLAMLLGFLVGFATCRFGLRAFTFAIGTLLLAEMLRQFSTNSSFLKGSMGIIVPVPVDAPARGLFVGIAPYYYVSLIMLLVMLFVTYKIERGKLGWELKAIRENEDAAASLGIQVTRVKTMVVGLSAGLTAIGGAISALSLHMVYPDQQFSADVSIALMLATYLGGRGTVFGPVVGMVFLTVIRESISYAAGGLGTVALYSLTAVLWGIILMLVVKFLPRGILPWAQRQYHRVLSGRRKVEENTLSYSSSTATIDGRPDIE